MPKVNAVSLTLRMKVMEESAGPQGQGQLVLERDLEMTFFSQERKPEEAGQAALNQLVCFMSSNDLLEQADLRVAH